jgi:hypothetical protein
MKRIFKLFILVALVAANALTVMAQPNDGDLFEPVTDTPVNAGIVMMLAAGVGYGLKKLNQHKK